MESGLSQVHQDELQKYRKFLDLKRKEALNEFEMMISDFKEDNLQDELYNKDDVSRKGVVFRCSLLLG